MAKEVPTVRYNRVDPLPQSISGVFLIAVPMTQGALSLVEDVVAYWGPKDGAMSLYRLDGDSMYGGPVLGWIGPIERSAAIIKAPVQTPKTSKIETPKTEIFDV